MPWWGIAGWLLAAAPAPGSSPGDAIELSWSVAGPASCDADAFRGELDRLLGRGPADLPSGLTVAVELGVDAAGRWSAELHLREPGGETSRRFEAARCETVVEAAALVVAMRIDPALSGAPPQEPPPVPGPTPTPTPRPPPPPVSRAADGLRLAVGVEGGLAALALPGVTGQLGAFAALLGRRFRAGLGGRHRFTTRAAAERPRIGGEFSLWAGQAHGCGVPTAGAIEVPLCLAFEAGALVAQGYGADENTRSVRPWLALRARPGLWWVPHRAVGLGVSLDAGFPLTREGYRIEGVGGVWRVGPVELGALLGVEFRALAGGR